MIVIPHFYSTGHHYTPEKWLCKSLKQRFPCKNNFLDYAVLKVKSCMTRQTEGWMNYFLQKSKMAADLVQESMKKVFLSEILLKNMSDKTGKTGEFLGRSNNVKTVEKQVYTTDGFMEMIQPGGANRQKPVENGPETVPTLRT